MVFSIVDKASFRVAEEIINYLWQENYTKDKAVILVGNKADLARSRVITSQGNTPNIIQIIFYSLLAMLFAFIFYWQIFLCHLLHRFFFFLVINLLPCEIQ